MNTAINGMLNIRAVTKRVEGLCKLAYNKSVWYKPDIVKKTHF